MRKSQTPPKSEPKTTKNATKPKAENWRNVAYGTLKDKNGSRRQCTTNLQAAGKTCPKTSWAFKKPANSTKLLGALPLSEGSADTWLVRCKQLGFQSHVSFDASLVPSTPFIKDRRCLFSVSSSMSLPILGSFWWAIRPLLFNMATLHPVTRAILPKAACQFILIHRSI